MKSRENRRGKASFSRSGFPDFSPEGKPSGLAAFRRRTLSLRMCFFVSFVLCSLIAAMF